jgi:hypothetical protein
VASGMICRRIGNQLYNPTSIIIIIIINYHHHPRLHDKLSEMIMRHFRLMIQLLPQLAAVDAIDLTLIAGSPKHQPSAIIIISSSSSCCSSK